MCILYIFDCDEIVFMLLRVSEINKVPISSPLDDIQTALKP